MAIKELPKYLGKGQEVTINKIRDGVMATLYSHFPNMDIYGEEIKEGLTPPCFFVKMLQTTHRQDLDRRYMRNHFFDIHFFSDGDKNRDLHNMAENLYDVLELIGIDGVLYRGTGMNHEIVDRVLHFFVEYNFNVYKQKPIIPTMQDLEQKGGVKP